ncbi:MULTISPECIES: glycosyltransferase family 2 protein [unclassified Knoellia]|uniref:glycosyltransferase family 2 protein n=1 Tax=Knoellia altitudinis TaxID=3404795 RepID=UPI003617CDAE
MREAAGDDVTEKAIATQRGKPGTPLVSVVVPVYNVSPYVDECFGSLVGQSYENLEIIVIDDGSTDTSGEMCDGWAAQDRRVSVAHTSNQGLSAARNAGIELATGTYVTFVDSDDVVAVDFIEDLVTLAQAHGADVVTTDVVPFGQSAEQPTYRRGSTPLVEEATTTLRRIVCEKPRWGPMAKLYHRNVLDGGPRFLVGRVIEDLHFAPRAYSRAHTSVFSDDALYGHRQRDGSITSHQRATAFSKDLLHVLEENIVFARQTSRTFDEFDALTSAYLIHASKHIEMMTSESAWRRNSDFVRAYRDFARAHRGDVVRSRAMGRGYRLLFLLSSLSPRMFSNVFRVGKRLKQSGLPGLHRSQARV